MRGHAQDEQACVGMRRMSRHAWHAQDEQTCVGMVESGRPCSSPAKPCATHAVGMRGYAQDEQACVGMVESGRPCSSSPARPRAT